VKPRKTWEALLAGRRVVPFDDFARLLLALAQFMAMVEEFGLTMEDEQ
jgi:hypothetical protein